MASRDTGRTVVLGLGDQVLDFCKGGVACFCGDADGDQSRLVDRPAENLIPRFFIDRQGFSSDRGLVDAAGSLDNHAVGWNLVPSPDLDHVAGLQGFGFDLFKSVFPLHPGFLRSQPQQGFEVFSGTKLRPIFDQLGAHQEKGDECGGLILGASQGNDEAECGQLVHFQAVDP